MTFLQIWHLFRQSKTFGIKDCFHYWCLSSGPCLVARHCFCSSTTPSKVVDGKTCASSAPAMPNRIWDVTATQQDPPTPPRNTPTVWKHSGHPTPQTSLSGMLKQTRCTSDNAGWAVLKIARWRLIGLNGTLEGKWKQMGDPCQR